ncbi:MAG: NUDIX domain-containing protein [Candidatus Marinarcus sp.]|uniref:NUDIX domain-containing protein n=1 Tax=Candidatus Marinarcus sp. TaxID=3100987 RepID=UPI003B00BB59
MDKIKAYGVCIYKIKGNTTKILLCKSVKSQEKWGCLKGMSLRFEEPKDCARREFFEESSIKVSTDVFEEYFEQTNKTKDVGIWLVNAKNVEDIEDFFYEDTLGNNYLSWENSKVKFFNIDKLPEIKTKQKMLIQEIKSFLKNKSQSR